MSSPSFARRSHPVRELSAAQRRILGAWFGTARGFDFI